MTVPLALEGARAVITGAGSGIGRATAIAFARRGAMVVVTDLSKERAESVAAEICGDGAEAVPVEVDATSEADLAAALETSLTTYGGVDLVMNNVGVLAVGQPESLPDEAWARTLEINLLSIARSNRVFLPTFLAQGRGHVVNTASASGLLAYGFDRLPYVASKHAVRGLSEALAIYLGPSGIGVTCLCPSGVITNILEGLSVYGDLAISPRAPAHPIVEPEVVGEMVADAVEAGTFLVVTAPEIRDELVERATDIESYLAARIAEQTS